MTKSIKDILNQRFNKIKQQTVTKVNSLFVLRNIFNTNKKGNELKVSDKDEIKKYCVFQIIFFLSFQISKIKFKIIRSETNNELQFSALAGADSLSSESGSETPQASLHSF